MLPESVKRPPKKARPETMPASAARLLREQADPRRADVHVDLLRFAALVGDVPAIDGEPGGLVEAVAGAVSQTRRALAPADLAEVRATLEVIRAEADSTSRVIAQLGDLVRGQRSAPAPVVRLVNLNDLVIEALGVLGARARLGAGVSAVLDHALPSVAGDPVELREAIHAILVAPMRARETSPSPGGIAVRTSHETGVLRGERTVRVAVAGTERPAGDAALSVERWPDPALRLSIYLASRVAHQHGGVLTASAPADGGLALSFELPAV